MRSVLIGIVLSLSLSSCSALDLVKSGVSAAMGQEPGIEANVNAGQAKTEGNDSTAMNANTAISMAKKEEQVYQGGVGTVVNQGQLPFHIIILLVLLAGWAIPSPEEMAHGFVRVIKALTGR